MCKNFNGSHSGGSSFVNVNDCWLLQKLFVYHRYKLNSKKKKKKKKVLVHGFAPETGSDSPIGSDRDRGRDGDSHDKKSPYPDSVFYVPTEVSHDRGVLCHDRVSVCRDRELSR